MTKLNQIVAIEKGVKNQTHRDLTDLYHQIQRSNPHLDGLTKTYRPKDEEGDTLPPESKLVQVSVTDVLDAVAKHTTRLFDVVLTKDSANQTATGDIIVDGTTVASSVPVSYLLWLEKQLTDLHTVLKALPTLDPAETWTYDSNSGVFKAAVVTTTRSKKIPRNHVLAEATDRHPAQVQVYNEDVLVGYWDTIKMSGAIPADRRRQLVERVERLQEAVKFAREQANSIDVTDRKVGQAVFDYLLAA